MSSVEQAFCRSAPWRAFARRAVVPWVLKRQALGVMVLEIGGGSGAMAQAVLTRFPAVELVVTDCDDAMVEAATARLRGFGERVRLQQADTTSLPFADGDFDAVLSFLMLHHVIDWERAVAECARVLRPGGMFIGYDLTESSVAHVIHRVDRSPHRLVGPEEFRKVAVDAGLDGEVRPEFGSQLMRFSYTRRF